MGHEQCGKCGPFCFSCLLTVYPCRLSSHAIFALSFSLPQENMAYMFRRAPKFNGDISSWDTANVKNMGLMFGEANSFNGDISSWDTSAYVYVMW